VDGHCLMTHARTHSHSLTHSSTCTLARHQIIITDVKPGSAGASAGLQANDLVVSIGGAELTGKTVPVVKKALQVGGEPVCGGAWPMRGGG
jgi:predicted metalloprotease with PDZ domain